jgi:hypothetical protein
MEIAMATTNPSRGLLIHAMATPVVFAVVSLIHWRLSPQGSPASRAMILTP